jgi:hypothetical protein
VHNLSPFGFSHPETVSYEEIDLLTRPGTENADGRPGIWCICGPPALQRTRRHHPGGSGEANRFALGIAKSTRKSRVASQPGSGRWLLSRGRVESSLSAAHRSRPTLGRLWLVAPSSSVAAPPQHLVRHPAPPSRASGAHPRPTRVLSTAQGTELRTPRQTRNALQLIPRHRQPTQRSRNLGTARPRTRL